MELEQQEDQLRLLRLLQEMPEMQRQIIESRVERDETYSEIGHHVGMTPDAVRKAYGRALQQLRNFFEAAVAVPSAIKQAE